MFTSTTPTVKPLGNDLTLKSVSTEEDITRLAQFNVQIHDEYTLVPMTHGLIRHHPHTRPHHWLFVEDDASAQIVSALCLIPWQWRYDDVTLHAGEMGIVGTHEDYRRRGLIRALNEHFSELLAEEGFHLSQIQGIPYYYRQFGYEYAIPLEGSWQIELRQIPDDPPDDAPAYTFRPASAQDIPTLQQFYAAANRSLDITTIRDADTWRYLLAHQDKTAADTTFWLALDANEEPAGYVRLEKFGFGEGLIVAEASRLRQPLAEAVLRWLKHTAVRRSKPYIRLALPTSSDLIQVAQGFGAQDTGRYAWQIRVPDPAHLLRAIGPVLERRITDSPFAGLTHTVRLNLYRAAFDLHFAAGRLDRVETAGFQQGGALQLPPRLFAPLVLGYRSLDDIQAFYPDALCSGPDHHLIDVLFPTMDAHIYTIY